MEPVPDPMSEGCDNGSSIRGKNSRGRKTELVALGFSFCSDFGDILNSGQGILLGLCSEVTPGGDP